MPTTDNYVQKNIYYHPTLLQTVMICLYSSLYVATQTLAIKPQAQL